MRDCEDDVRLLRGPDFLGIGGTRCGSTWLYANLRSHPGIWLPPRKELHYFDRSPSYNSPSHLADASLVTRLLSREKHNKAFRRRAAGGIGKSLVKPGELFWNLRYFLGRYDDDWYASLFRMGKNKIKGEITPAYSMLSREDVLHIRQIMPEVKIIFIMRNPIDRTWSGMRKTEVSTLPHEELASLLENPFARSDYVRTISTWRSVFPKEQLYIGFFDDITESPERLLLQLFSFLGVSAETSCISVNSRARINAAKDQEMPRDIRTILARKFIVDLEKLNGMVGGRTEKWLADARAALRSA